MPSEQPNQHETFVVTVVDELVVGFGRVYGCPNVNAVTWKVLGFMPVGTVGTRRPTRFPEVSWKATLSPPSHNAII